MNNSFNETFRYGSAGWADESAIRQAGLLQPKGLQIGYWENRALYLDGDAPMITIGGAGSGKLRDLLAYVVCNSPGQRFIALDPRGELGAISIHMHALHGEDAYFWNPMASCGLPQHRSNPLDILTMESLTLHADSKFLAEGFITSSGGGNGRYFELRAQEWLDALMKSRVEQNGRVSLPDLYRTVNVIESDQQTWADQVEAMLASRFDGVKRVASEMLTKQQDTPKEFGAIMGEIYGHLSFLDDPVLLASLEESDFSMAALCDPDRVCKIFLNIPAEYLGIWSPLVRLFFTTAILYKTRVPQRERIVLVVDEAGQLGRFETLLRAFTYGRGAGVRAWAIFQDDGQIARNFGQPALQSFFGSAQMRQFFGVRDYSTARLVSSMLGTETLEYDDPLQQAAARRQKWETVRSVLGGADPFEAAYDYAHYRRNAENRVKQARALLTPDEVLALPEDHQVLFISGKNLKPILASKHPYFTRREMAGRYLANPYHPPLDSVPIATRFGSRRVPVITAPVPRDLARFPQHRDGTRSYVKGFERL